jgi:hypothetical protein
MPKNIEILKAQAYVHDLKCLTSLFKRLFELPDNSLAFDEYEKEAMIDQLDQAADRLELLDRKLEDMKAPNPDCGVIMQENGTRNIYAIFTGKLLEQRRSNIPQEGNGNGNRTQTLQDIPDMQA